MALSLKTHTLGCNVNQYETEYVRQGLISAGYRAAEQEEAADLCIVNTCTVTNEGDSKSRQVIRRMARDNPEARIVVMGCYATRAPDELAALPGVVEVVTDKRELPDLLGRFGVVEIPTGIGHFGDRHRAYIKVQDGCLLRCSYCIIPKVRPQLYSRSPEHIVDEARRLLGNGYRELVLTGVHLGHYGVEGNFNKPKEQWLRLSRLLEQLVQLEGDFRIRLSSIEATEVTRELLDVMAGFPEKICPHLHVCLQSGSDRILRRMKRRWGQKRFVDRCLMVKQRLDRPAFTTDVIVGFPGETEEDFSDTLSVLREVGFSKVHCFPFSARKGTPAAEMSDPLSKQVKAERGRRVAALETELRNAYFRELVGKPLRVLVETTGEQPCVRGTACRYATVELSGEPSQIGSLVDVLPNGLSEDCLSATAIDAGSVPNAS